MSLAMFVLNQIPNISKMSLLSAVNIRPYICLAQIQAQDKKFLIFFRESLENCRPQPLKNERHNKKIMMES